MKERLLLLSVAALAAGIACLLKDTIAGRTPDIKTAASESTASATPVHARIRRAPGASETSAADSRDLPPGLDPVSTTPTLEQHMANLISAPAGDAATTSRALFAMIPALPEDTRAVAAEHAVLILPDADYASIALPMVMSAQTHGSVMSVLFDDLMQRPDAVTLPALLRIAKNPGHAFAPVAVNNLKLLLNADFGDEWARWDLEIRRVLDSARHSNASIPEL